MGPGAGVEEERVVCLELIFESFWRVPVRREIGLISVG